MGSSTCPQCGAVNPAGAKFCDDCGISLTQHLHAATTNIAPSSSAPAPKAAPAGTPSATGGLAATTGSQPASVGTGKPGARSGPLNVPEIGSKALAPGVTLSGGRYVIDKALGKGGMGSIFLAHDTRLDDKTVVIKEMLQNFANDQERIEAEQAFVGERKTLAALKHPNIPQITDFPSESGRYFIVQDHVDGEDLQRKFDSAHGKGLPERQVLQWASQVLSVLDYLEKCDPQVVHRDIKPANILVDTSGRIQVVDFGVASHRFRVGSVKAAVGNVTAAMGTPGYAPREQFTGNETPQSDLYALGATLHQLLTGRNPQGVEPLFSYPPVRKLNPAVSEATEQIVAKALQNDPAKRWQHAAEMKAAIDALLQPKTFLSTARGRLVSALVLLVLLAAVGVSATLYGTRHATRQTTTTIVVTPVGIVRVGQTAASVTLRGSGSSFAQPFLASALTAYAKSNPVAVTYDPNGSGQGITQFTNNQTDFGVSDVPMNSLEAAVANRNGSGVLQLPILLGGVAVTYNLDLPAHTTLRIDGPTLANIFLGKITSWNDPAIAALNPGVSLPSIPIVTVHRSDSSGTTYIFSNYLSAISPTFSLHIGANKLENWPSGVGATGNVNVANQILARKGALGYVEVKFATDNKLPLMMVENAAHQFVSPTPDAILAAANQFPNVTAKDFSIVNAPGAASYPISGYSWGLVRAHHANVPAGEALIAMFTWLTTAGQSYTAPLNYVPLPDPVQLQSKQTLEKVHVG
jgi:phosphate transport system substrate-binding protein